MWTPQRIAEYLGEWGVSVVQSGTGFSLHKPPGMALEQFEFIAGVAKSHIVPQRDEFVRHIVPRAGDQTPLYRNLPPAEKRREDYRRLYRRADLLRESFGWESRVLWSSTYDQSTGCLVAGKHKAFPEHATGANLQVKLPPWARTAVSLEGGHTTTEIVDQFGTVLVYLPLPGDPRCFAFPPWRWLVLAASRPPPKWREYAGFVPPPDWHAPPGWEDREAKRHAAAVKAAKRKWYRDNWHSEHTLPD